MPDPNVNDYTYMNEINVCGRIIYKRPDKNGNLFVISVSRKLHKPKTDSGTGKKVNFEYKLIDVYFEGATGKLYNKMYETGDFVLISGVAQKTRNNYTARDMVKVLGLSMMPKMMGNYETKDKNYVTIRGKIEESAAISDNYIICNLYTNVHKKFKNPNTENKDVTSFEDDFVSSTPVGIRRPGDAKSAIKDLTKGTWVDITGMIDTKKLKLKDGQTITETRIIARDIYIVGQVQKIGY